MVSFILFVTMCVCVVIIAIGNVWDAYISDSLKKNVWWIRLRRCCLALFAPCILFQHYVFLTLCPMVEDGLIAVPEAWGINLICCMFIYGCVDLACWIWHGKW